MEELSRIRTDFVQTVSLPGIKGIVDVLLEKKVFSAEEKDSVTDQRGKADSARCLIDMVIGKGKRASQMMIDIMKDKDPELFFTLFSSHTPDMKRGEDLVASVLRNEERF